MEPCWRKGAGRVGESHARKRVMSSKRKKLCMKKNFLSSWFWEDGKSETKEDKEVRERSVKKGKEAGRGKKMKRLSRENA